MVAFYVASEVMKNRFKLFYEVDIYVTIPLDLCGLFNSFSKNLKTNLNLFIIHTTLKVMWYITMSLYMTQQQNHDDTIPEMEPRTNVTHIL